MEGGAVRINTRRCGPRKGSIDSTERKLLPARTFALPGRRYPLYVVSRGEAVPDREHAVNAKARATQQFERGRLSSRDLATVRRKADQVIAMCDRIEGRAAAPRKSKTTACGCSSPDASRVIKALPRAPAVPMLQHKLQRHLGMSSERLERALRDLWKRGKISREILWGEPAWRAGTATPGTRGKFTVKLYCNDGSTKRAGASSWGDAQKKAQVLRERYAGPCAVAIVDEQGVILQHWEG
jgi:hypothetical protein